MEVTVYEDPACSWCWAFEPVATTFAFEFREAVKLRRVMGGLRDRPTADPHFVIEQWKKAEAVSGMPFVPEVWERHSLMTTFVACRAVKAAAIQGERMAEEFLRRLREAFFTEQEAIDDPVTVLRLAVEAGLPEEPLRESLANGRAEALFARDRVEAAQHGFGFPTLVLCAAPNDPPIVLQGAVPYADLLQALSALGLSLRHRKRFRDIPEHWTVLFRIHRRLTSSEIRMVTGIDRQRLDARLEALGLHKEGPFYVRGSPRTPVDPRAARQPAASPGAGAAPAIAGNLPPEPEPAVAARTAPSLAEPPNGTKAAGGAPLEGPPPTGGHE